MPPPAPTRIPSPSKRNRSISNDPKQGSGASVAKSNPPSQTQAQTGAVAQPASNEEATQSSTGRERKLSTSGQSVIAQDVNTATQPANEQGQVDRLEKPALEDTQARSNKLQRTPGTKVSNTLSIQRSRSTRQPTQPALPPKTSNPSSKPRSTSSISAATTSNTSQSPRNGSGAATKPKSTGVAASARAHVRTQSVNAPPKVKAASTPSTRNPSAAISQHRAASTASKPEHRNPSSISSTRPTTSTSRNATPQARRDIKPSTASAPPTAKPARPAFSTYEQNYTPSRRVPGSSSKAAALSKRPPHAAPTPAAPAPDLAQLRAQTHLLHLSLFHAAAPATQKAYLASAEAALESRFTALYTLYTRTLVLARDARQARNLVALHAWSGGNTAALSRKLSVLTGVLAELMALTAPAARPTDGDGEGDVEVEAEAGSYAQCVARFEQWAAWVRGVWALRDAEEAAQAAKTDAEADAHADADAKPAATATAAADTSAKDMHIDGLGDATKASLRALTAQLNTLHVRLEDAAVPGVPDVATDTGTDSGTASTPAHVLSAARQLVRGMLEELQVMREVEFEIVVGEQAWMEERVRRIGEEIDGF